MLKRFFLACCSMTTHCVLESIGYSSDFHKNFYSYKVIDGFVISACHNVHGFPYFDIQIPLNCTLDNHMFISVYQIFAQNSNVQNSTAR